jgi:hypothetical protein
MGEPDFPTIRERLLRGGIAPKHVRRTIGELRDHYADLVAEAMSRGAGSAQAASEARQRLGDEETLVAEVLGRRELRSWAHRWPWAIYGLTPPLILVAAISAVLIALFVPIYVLTSQWGRGWMPPGWFQLLVEIARGLSMFGLPLMVAAGVCLSAGRRRSGLLWPLVGVVLVALIGGAIDLQIRWPRPGQPGALSVGLSLLPPFPGFGGMLLRTALSTVLVLVPFHWLRTRHQPARAPA